MDDSNLHTDTHHYMQQICFNAAASVHIKENSTSLHVSTALKVFRYLRGGATDRRPEGSCAEWLTEVLTNFFHAARFLQSIGYAR